MSYRWRRNQRDKCECLGYWFPHRKGGGTCNHSKTREIHLALRTGDPDQVADARVAHAMAHGIVSTICPF